MHLGPFDAEPTTSRAEGDRGAPFSPTSLDLLIDRVHRSVPTLIRASDRLLTAGTAALAVIDVGVWATDAVVVTGRHSISLAALVPLLGAFAVVAVATRPRRPALALTALAATGIGLTIATWAVGNTSLPPSFAALFALALLTTRVLRREPGRVALLLAMTACLAVAAESLRPMVPTAAYLLVLCEGAFAVAVGAGVYLRWSDWRRVASEAAARIDERLQIARELHDMVGHHVTGMVVRAQAARHVSMDRSDVAVAALESIEAAGIDAMDAMHRMVGSLRAGPTAPGGSWDDVDQLIATAVDQGYPVRSEIHPDIRSTAPELVPSVHRIIAESLTNVRRHARGVQRIEVAVRRRANQLVITVQDDGEDAVPPGRDSFGVVGMRERTASLGGSLVAGPVPGGGWLVRAELPVERPR